MNQKLRAAACVAVLGLVSVAGCGSGRSESSNPESPDSTTSVSASGTFGSLADVCGPGDAAGATDQGVTDTSITIGYGDDAGFPQAPGLGHAMSDAMKAFTAWCNDAGGINGREIIANYHDAAVTEVAHAVTEACATDFFLVGQGWSLDSAQEVTRRTCGLPAVAGYSASPQFSNAPLKWEPLPNPADKANVTPADYFTATFPDAVHKAATMYANFPATIDARDKTVAAFTTRGFDFLDCDQQYSIQGEADWRPFLQKLKDCGAEFVYYSGSAYPNFENVLTAAGQIDYEPIWYVDANFYTNDFRDWNTSGLADRTYMREYVTPFEEAADNPATQQYLDIVARYGGDTSLIGAQSASAFLLWATAAKACGSELTRSCVAGQLDTITDWTGGGLHASANPGANIPSSCGLMLGMSGQSYVRLAPEEPATYQCDPDAVVTVTGPVIDRARLDGNRISQL